MLLYNKNESPYVMHFDILGIYLDIHRGFDFRKIMQCNGLQFHGRPIFALSAPQGSKAPR